MVAGPETIRVVNKHGAEIWGPALPGKLSRKFEVGAQDVPVAYFTDLMQHGLHKGVETLVKSGLLQLGDDPPAPVEAVATEPEPATVAAQLDWISHETNHETLAELARDSNALVATAADDRINQIEK